MKTNPSSLVFTLSIAAALIHPSLAFAQEKIGNQTPPQSIDKAIEAKDALFDELSGKLKQVLTTRGPVAAIEVCGQEARNMTQSVGESLGLKIGRTAWKLRNSANQPPQWAKPLLEKATEKPLFTPLPNHRTGALFPIKLKAQCLICHGEKMFIPGNVQEELAKRYPKDQATGFRVDELRGWFWVEVDDKDPAQYSSWFQYGEMHRVIGQKDHKGRVSVDSLTKHDNLYAVGAIEGLQGEITILDSVPYVTTIQSKNKLKAAPITKDLQATLLMGASVSNWQDTTFESTLGPDKWESYLEQTARDKQLDTNSPILFQVKGTFTDVIVHVINGACPIHAQLHEKELAPEEQPHQHSFPSIQGHIVGVFAKAASGRLTHPGTSVHAHLIYQSPETGEWLTGHIEKTSITQGSTLSLPKAGDLN